MIDHHPNPPSRVLTHLSAIVAACVACAAPVALAVDPIADSEPGLFQHPNRTVHYRLFEPTVSTASSLPVVVFLHGAGEQGTNNTTQVSSHVSNLIDRIRGTQYPAYLIAPQTTGGSWDGQGVRDLVEYVAQSHNIDRSRVYVTGLSMGGGGTYRAVEQAPGLYAAAAPLSAVSQTSAANELADIPVWLFHGTSDSTVGVGSSDTMYNQIKGQGGSPRYSRVSGWGHGNWNAVYNDDPFYTGTYGQPAVANSSASYNTPSTGLYDWMFSQVNASPDAAPLPPAVGESVRFDLGATGSNGFDSRGQWWNVANDAPTSVPYAAPTVAFPIALDSDGNRTSVNLEIVEGFEGQNNNGAIPSTRFDSDVAIDTWYVGSSSTTGADNPGTLRLSGLTPGSAFLIELFASRASTGNDLWTRYTIGSELEELNAANNTLNTAVFDSVLANGSGFIDLLVERRPGGTYGYLNSISLTALDVPEPTSLAWAALLPVLGRRTRNNPSGSKPR